MAHVIRTYAPLLTTGDGRVYAARSVGREREDGTWEGWLEFVPSDASPVIRSARETTQPNLADLEYWASGLTAVYLEGALERTLTPPPVITVPAPERPVYDEPAPPATPVVVTEEPEPEAILDPFAVYAKGESLLRRQLGALAPRHLRNIILAYDLAEDIDVEALTEPELIELIVSSVRRRRAA
jgi:hypothetical protein